MKKSHIVTEALAAAELAITVLDGGGDVDTTTFDKWTEALLRNVFYHYKQREDAQSIENLHWQFLNTKDKPAAIAILREYIIEVNALAATATDLNSYVTWEPPFDRTLLYPNE